MRGLIDEILDADDVPTWTAPPLEVGVTYTRTRDSAPVLAVAPGAVATVSGEWPAQEFEVRPAGRRRYLSRPDISVLDLCFAWNVEVAELDEFARTAIAGLKRDDR